MTNMFPVEAITPCKFQDVRCLGLMWSAGTYSHELLITKSDDAPSPRGIILGKDHQFAVVEGDAWDGILLQPIQLEVDPASAFDAGHLYSPYGALIRSGQRLVIAARALDGHRMGYAEEVPLLIDLPEASDGLQTGFYSWRIVFVDGDQRRVIREFLVEPAEGPPR